jgi:hypothetical protein
MARALQRLCVMNPEKREDEPSLPVRRGTSDDPSSPREIENPGDPGPPVLVPPEQSDPRDVPAAPGLEKPPAGV